MKGRENLKKILVIFSVLLILAIISVIFIMGRNNIVNLAKNDKEEIKAILSSEGNWIYTVTNKGVNIQEYYGSKNVESISIPSTIDGYTVTGIGTGSPVFNGCSKLKSISNIPSSVTNIGDGAFMGCSALTAISIPSNVTSIGNRAFMSCTSLKSVSIPTGITSIGEATFLNCTSLTSVGISSTVISIGNSAFRGCEALTGIVIPSSVTSIGESAFNSCSGLTSVNIPSSVTSIGNSAFSGCTSLTSVSISKGITSIGENTFNSCTSLTSIYIPSSVTSIANNAFSGDNNVTIHCRASSKAHEYAKENSINYDLTLNLSSIVVKTNPTKMSYIQNFENLDLAGGELTLTYSDNWTGTISMKESGVTNSGFSNSAVGTVPVTISYGGKNTTLNVTVVAKTLTRINVKTNPTKMSYIQNFENLDLTGGELTLTYSDNSTETKSMKAQGVTNSGFSNSAVGTVPVTISYGGKSTTLNVTVVAKTLTRISVKTNPTKMSYIQGYENLNLAGGELTLTYNDNSTGTISMTASGVTNSGFSNSTVGTVPVTIRYGGKSTTLNVTVVAKTLTGISVKTNPTKMSYIQGYENLNLAGGELTLTYNDNSTGTISMTASGVTNSGFSNSTVGTVPVTISYGGKSTTLNVTVVASSQPQKTLSEISVKTPPTKTTYKKGEDLDLRGGIITLKYTDNTTEEVEMTSNKVNVTGFSNTTVGKKELTVTYENKTTKFEVEIIGNIEHQPTTDGNGVVITGGDPGETIVVIPDKIDGKPVIEIGPGAFKDRDDLISVDIPDTVTKIADDAFDGSEDTIIICNPGSKAEEFAKEHDMSYIYRGKTISGISVKTLPIKITYTQGTDSKLDLTGGRLTVSYSGTGITSVLRMTSKGVTASNVDMTTVGTKPVTISYKGKSATPFEVTVGGTQSTLLGDIDGNGVIDATDLLLMKRHIIAGSKTEWILTGDKFTRGDMNTDGLINPTDLLLLKREIVKKR